MRSRLILHEGLPVSLPHPLVAGILSLPVDPLRASGWPQLNLPIHSSGADHLFCGDAFGDSSSEPVPGHVSVVSHCLNVGRHWGPLAVILANKAVVAT